MDRLYTGARDTGALLYRCNLCRGAWEDETLVGVCRVLSDDASILYVQDILVDPDHQRRGIGRALLERVLERYSHCRQKVLMTDDRPEQKAFYEALGFTRLDLREGPTLRALSNFRLSYPTRPECGRNLAKLFSRSRARYGATLGGDVRKRSRSRKHV